MQLFYRNALNLLPLVDRLKERKILQNMMLFSGLHPSSTCSLFVWSSFTYFSAFVCCNASREYFLSFKAAESGGHRATSECLGFVVCLCSEAVKSWSFSRLQLPQRNRGEYLWLTAAAACEDHWKSGVRGQEGKVMATKCWFFFRDQSYKYWLKEVKYQMWTGSSSKAEALLPESWKVTQNLKRLRFVK